MSEDDVPLIATDRESRELLGMFDTPSFARRGADVEYALKRFHERLGRERDGMLDMVRTRLRQWAAASEPGTESRFFQDSILALWPLAGAPEPVWNTAPASDRRLRSIARDLVASVERFNRRWSAFLDKIDTDALNQRIDQFNRNYLLEKECVLGSSRLASRFFQPLPRIDRPWLDAHYPPLTVPRPAGGPAA
jgi:hypothetical protein